MLMPCTRSAFESMMMEELTKRPDWCGDLTVRPKQAQRYRPLGVDEIEEMKAFVAVSSALTLPAVCGVLSKRVSFSGISNGEIRRGIRRHFSREKSGFVLREVPWPLDDPRLVETKPKKVPSDTTPDLCQVSATSPSKRPRSPSLVQVPAPDGDVEAS
jgi:hypothetical protein